MAIPLEIRIREAYAAFGRGDIEGYFSECTEEFSFNVPGRGALAGMYCGKSGIHELARKAIEISSGNFPKKSKTFW